MHFVKKLKQALRETNSHLIVGLDTDVTKIPQFFKSAPNPIADFNNSVISATKDYVCGYKLNIAFYEKETELGWAAITSTIANIPQNLITIADAKRGDIENTTELYAQAFLDGFGFDSITVQPYMGQDSARPFLRRKNKFVWLLALTSNYGAKDFQFLKINKKPLWEVVTEKAITWNDHKIGFVVGANHTNELKKITKAYPDTPILVPGIGIQKNSLEKTVASLSHNLFVINQSRSIIYSAPKAQNETEFCEILSENAMKARDEINMLLVVKKKK
ncbi:MAG: orotidine-5'-phosphate decarboxylase [Chlorobi bacterium]|nr:orotidine-5'-phosphate decarboxylase [Chlorobiota bacterium]MCI0716906.1 orotidine-5'-phosphate decarboxylase [Chlorobiota bacterium]